MYNLKDTVKMNRKTLGKKLRAVTISPLIIGVIACSVISIALVIQEHLNWLQNSKDNLLKDETIYLNRISESFSESFKTYSETVFFKQIFLDLIYLSKIYMNSYEKNFTNANSFSNRIISAENSMSK